jgi:uncharacterized membrane protein YhaH (DUF805 family)
MPQHRLGQRAFSRDDSKQEISMDWMLLPLKRYADFQGRSRRMEYWMFTLGIVIVEVVLFALFFMLGAFSPSETGAPSAMTWPMMIVFIVLGLGLIVPALAVQVRRFHDQDKSGWFVLLGLIPYVGGLIVLVFMCLPGTPGPNRFGPDPLGGTGDLAQTFR